MVYTRALLMVLIVLGISKLNYAQTQSACDSLSSCYKKLEAEFNILNNNKLEDYQSYLKSINRCKSNCYLILNKIARKCQEKSRNNKSYLPFVKQNYERLSIALEQYDSLDIGQIGIYQSSEMYLANYYMRDNNNSKALEHYKNILRVNPNNSLARRAIEHLKK